MGAQKPLIVPWLVEQLDTQRYPGVSWLNAERTLFRVPWKHGSRQSISPEDFQIFEDWAIVRSLYNPGTDPRTPSEWKRNFRSALNRKDGIEMVKDNSTDSKDPHKVYKINHNIANLNGPAVGAASIEVSDAPLVPAESRRPWGISSSSSQDETLEDVLNSLDLSSPDKTLGEDCPGWFETLSPSKLDLAISTMPVTPLEQTGGTDEIVPYTGIGADNTICCGGPPSSNLELNPSIATILPLEQLMATQEFETDFEVRTFYRGRLVLSEVFRNSRGLCFVPPGVSGNCPGLADVLLPDPAILSDQLQASFTRRLLKGVAPGVLLCIEGNQLCGMRKGTCHVFWSLSEMPGDGVLHGELLKEQFAPIFNLQLFVSELIGYIEGRNDSPNYTRWLCFGETWPDFNRSWKKKLIMVQIIPKVLETLCELGQIWGASSLKGNEPDLRISDSLQYHNFLEQLRKWEEKMEIRV
ncbi:interferon regulatory factor 3 [Python bivittatus]|uniref:Interferon regulatory factor 3 n=1 Tax=Python bivittatus TaxID=176946 RepID=A0A9F3QS11_PYTBI|nr:interferon regulatory factor 3 [Python bivittatus]XP_025019814.1 interferon regulatory factor 3 [Python bivittatus]